MIVLQHLVPIVKPNYESNNNNNSINNNSINNNNNDSNTNQPLFLSFDSIWLSVS